MSGHNENYSEWWYDPQTRMWDDGTGNKYHSLPVGVTIEQTQTAPKRKGFKAYEEGDIVCYSGTFTPKAYGDWFRSRLQRLYSL